MTNPHVSFIWNLEPQKRMEGAGDSTARKLQHLARIKLVTLRSTSPLSIFHVFPDLFFCVFARFFVLLILLILLLYRLSSNLRVCLQTSGVPSNFHIYTEHASTLSCASSVSIRPTMLFCQQIWQIKYYPMNLLLAFTYKAYN